MKKIEPMFFSTFSTQRKRNSTESKSLFSTRYPQPQTDRTHVTHNLNDNPSNTAVKMNNFD